MIKIDNENFELITENETKSLYDKDGNKLLTFNGKIGSIIQINDDTTIHFIITENYYPHWNHCSFNHYIYMSENKKLKLCFSRDTDIYRYDDIYVSLKAYILKEKDDYFLYNLDSLSKRFDKIYNEEDIKTSIDDNVVMTSEVRTSSDKTIEDRIVYGIDKNDYSIKTPIWSNLQQRFIDMDNKTIEEEIDLYLDLLSNILKVDEKDIRSDEIFLKKFFPVQK